MNYAKLVMWAVIGMLGQAGAMADAMAEARTDAGCSVPADIRSGQRGGEIVGDAERGRLVFATCRTCHYPEQSVGHNNGPSLWNIFALQVGSQPGFDYSQALRNAEFIWTPQLLDLWLQDTVNFLPGNMMMSPGESDPQRRADLIEYLKQVSTPSGS